MATQVTMPQLGLTMTTGTITAWLKEQGESVTRGEALFEVENDKSTVEVEAPVSGILGAVLVPADQEVPVGTLLAWLIAPGEQIPGQIPSDDRAPAAAATAAAPAAEGAPAPVAAPTPAPASADGFVSASPRARALARERGIDLSTLAGSGPQGSVVEADIPAERAESGGTSTVERRTLSRIQVAGAQRMSESWNTIPQFTLNCEIDAQPLVTLHRYYREQDGFVSSLNLLLVKLLAITVREFPLLNARRIDEKTVDVFSRVNVGIAMDSTEGLVVPVLQDAGSTPLAVLAERWQGLAGRVRAGRGTAEDYADATITISNLGMYGIDSFRAIVNPPQVAILSVGALRSVPRPGVGGVQWGSAMAVAITADHRVVDGAYAARFLQRFAALAQVPGAWPV